MLDDEVRYRHAQVIGAPAGAGEKPMRSVVTPRCRVARGNKHASDGVIANTRQEATEQHDEGLICRCREARL